MTYGRTRNKALKSANIDTSFDKWYKFAQDRNYWRRHSINSNVNIAYNSSSSHHNYNLRHSTRKVVTKQPFPHYDYHY